MKALFCWRVICTVTTAIATANVSWVHKSDVVKHTSTEKHLKSKKRAKLEDSPSSSSTSATSAKRQRSMVEAVSASQKKNELISDLIAIFVVADIPLQKLDSIPPFLHKHVNNGVRITGSSQLREIHLPKLQPEINTAIQGMLQDTPYVSVILDETTDSSSRLVLDVLFKVPGRDKPILVQTALLDTNINHSSLAQCVVEALGKYQIPLTKGSMDVLVGDEASDIRKAYKEILRPLMPNFLNVLCLSHQLNLAGEKWRDNQNNYLVAKYTTLMNSVFSRSTEVWIIPISVALLQCNAVERGSWYEAVVANNSKLAAIHAFVAEKCSIGKDTPSCLLELRQLTANPATSLTISLLLAFASTCMKRLSVTLDAFQLQQPQANLVVGRVRSLMNYYSSLSASSDLSDVGIHSVIQEANELSEEDVQRSVLACQEVCAEVASSIKNYIDKQPSWPFFEVARACHPLVISSKSDTKGHDIVQYKAAPWLF